MGGSCQWWAAQWVNDPADRAIRLIGRPIGRRASAYRLRLAITAGSNAAGQTTGTVMQTAVIVIEAPLLGWRAIMTAAPRLRAGVRPVRAMSGEP